VNLSAVHIYAEDYTAGSAQAKRALTLVSDSIAPVDYPALAPAIYNYGLSARALGNKEESELAFDAYAQLDSTSRYARTAGLRSDDAVNVGKHLSEAGDSMDVLHFGATQEEVERSLGESEFIENLGGSAVLGYPSQGLSIHLFDGDGVLLLARGSFEGDLSGIRIGVVRHEVTDKLGPPTTSSASGWLEYPERRLSIKVINDHVVAMLAHNFE
jgi:hypothetical protein